jgi:hypothetical protein
VLVLPRPFVEERDIFDRIYKDVDKCGYYGFFHAKPSGPCLETTETRDGCAIFYKKDTFNFKGYQTFQYDTIDTIDAQGFHLIRLECLAPPAQ